MYNTRLTICVPSADSYADIMKIYLKAYNVFCIDCPYELCLATNSTTYENIRVINSYDSNDNFVDRLRLALKNIDTKYILVMNDDTIITGKMDYSKLESILDDMDKYNLNYCSFFNKYKGKKLYKGAMLYRVKEGKAYAKNFMVSIFNKEYLVNELGEEILSGWEMENKWNSTIEATIDGYYPDIVSCRTKIIPHVHGVSKGRWFESAIDILSELGIEIQTNRGTISKSKELFMITYSRIGKIFSTRARRRMKKILSKIGFRFTTEN